MTTAARGLLLPAALLVVDAVGLALGADVLRLTRRGSRPSPG